MGENLYDFVLRNGPLNLIQKAQMTSGGKKKNRQNGTPSKLKVYVLQRTQSGK